MNIHAKFKFTDILYEKKQGVAWIRSIVPTATIL